MADTFVTQVDKSNPATKHFQITPDDTNPLPIMPRAIYCAAGGTAQVVDAAGTVLPYVMTAGQWIVLRALRINATSTTGTFYGWV